MWPRLSTSLIALCALVALPRASGAQCVEATECYCRLASSPILADGTIQSVGASEVVVAPTSVLLAPDGGPPIPMTISVTPNAGESVSEEVILALSLLQDGGWESPDHLDVASDGSIACVGLSPDQRFPKATVVSAILEGESCDSAMWDAGFVEPSCNDDHPTPFGCSSADGAGTAFLALTVGAWGLLSRRQRRKRRAH